jgi:hypothetical protein
MTATATPEALNVHTRHTFVRPSVQEIDVTTEIIDAIIPYYPGDCKCIAGYLDTENQYWKVNYHWDYLMSKIDEFLAMGSVAESFKKDARAIKEALEKNPPDPPTGYKDDKVVGATSDKSTHQTIRARHKILKKAKQDFEKVLVAAGVIDAKRKHNPPNVSAKSWWLAVAPVAAPGTSKHGTGYALDIAGDNAAIVRISKGLGATLAFNEASHVHCEWKHGVKLPE